VTRTVSIRIATLCLALATFAVPASAFAGQPLETESTRLLKPGSFEVEVGFVH